MVGVSIGGFGRGGGGNIPCLIYILRLTSPSLRLVMATLAVKILGTPNCTLWRNSRISRPPFRVTQSTGHPARKQTPRLPSHSSLLSQPPAAAIPTTSDHNEANSPSTTAFDPSTRDREPPSCSCVRNTIQALRISLLNTTQNVLGRYGGSTGHIGPMTRRKQQDPTCPASHHTVWGVGVRKVCPQET